MNNAYECGSHVVLIKDVASLPGLELGKIYEICHAVRGETGISGYRIRERLGDPDRWKGERWFVYPYEIAPVKKVEEVDSELIGKNPNFVIADEVEEGIEMEEVIYEVGDKVRIVNEKNGGNFGVGYVGNITKVDSTEKYKGYLIDNEWWYTSDELEPVKKFDNSIKEFITAYDPKEEKFSMPIATLPPIWSHIKMGGTLVEEKVFTHERYNEIIEDVINQIKELSEKKGGEYAGDVDRLANFRRNAKNLDLNMEDIWSVYAAKHWDAIQQYVKDFRSGKKRERLESISGRAHDLIVYLILFLAMVEERNN